MGGRTRAKAGSIQSLPLAAGAEHEQNGFHADAVGSPPAAAAEAMGIFVFGEQHRDALPQIFGDMPFVHDGLIHIKGVFHGCTSCAQLSGNNVSCTQ
jgi:hypothetical protein